MNTTISATADHITQERPLPAAWMRLLARCALLLLLVAVVSIGLAPNANAAVAPAGAPIGNQASATYVDTANPLVTLNSASNTVTTTVAQVYSFTFTAPGAQTRPANQQVCYPHTITNTGNGPDTIALNTPTASGMFNHTSMAYFVDAGPQDGIPDNMTPVTSTGILNPGQSYTFVVCGTTAAAATPGQTGNINVSATSPGGGTPVIVTPLPNITTIGNCTIVLSKTLSTTAPPGLTPVTGGLSPNTGAGMGGLFVVLNYTNSGPVACNTVVITDALPAGFRYRAGTGRWSNSGMTALTDANDTMVDPTGINYQGPADLTSGTITASIATVPGSTSGSVSFRVNIAPNQVVGITPATTNTATVTFIDSVSMTMGTGSSNPATYNVAQTADVGFNGSNNTSGNTDAEPVTVASAAPGQTIQWTDYVWNRGNAADNFDIRFVDGTGVATGTSATFNGANCATTNMAPACNFPANTVFTVFRSDGMTTLLDNSGNSIPDTANIPTPVAGTCPMPFVGNGAPGAHTACGYPIVVRAVIPATAVPGVGGPYTITLQARSVFDNSVVETVPNRLTAIVANSVDLTNNAPLPTTAANGSGPDDMSVKTINTVTPSVTASTTTRFQLYVNNTGAVPLVFDLSSAYVSVPASVGLVNPPINWQVQFRVDGGAGNCTTVGVVTTNTGVTPVPAGGNRLICAEVTIPPTNQGGVGRPTDSPPGNYVIRFRTEQSGNPSVFDTKQDQITLLAARAVAITPNGMQQTSPGGSVTYQHTITNTGNVPETITFPSGFLVDSGSPSWTSSGNIDDGGNQGTPVSNGMLDVGVDTALGLGNFVLGPNTSRTIFIRVNAPMAFSNTPNVTTVTATYTNGTSLTVQATDTTTMTAGLRLDKYQQLTACGMPVAAPTFNMSNIAQAPWVNTAIAAGPGTAPGQCIAYVIVAVNTTATNINNINISDIVPTNTQFQTACTPMTMTTGPIASVTPPNNFTGTITAASSPMATTPLLPGGRATVQFCVRINNM
jgi:trimeric autotransporter adhesin